MVRVGGGWDTLEHYLDKHDPCRCSSLCECPPGTAGTPHLPASAHRPPHPPGLCHPNLTAFCRSRLSAGLLSLGLGCSGR